MTISLQTHAKTPSKLNLPLDKNSSETHHEHHVPKMKVSNECQQKGGGVAQLDVSLVKKLEIGGLNLFTNGNFQSKIF
jgi:hypothetical protein